MSVIERCRDGLLMEEKMSLRRTRIGTTRSVSPGWMDEKTLVLVFSLRLLVPAPRRAKGFGESEVPQVLLGQLKCEVARFYFVLCFCFLNEFVRHKYR